MPRTRIERSKQTLAAKQAHLAWFGGIFRIVDSVHTVLRLRRELETDPEERCLRIE